MGPEEGLGKSGSQKQGHRRRELGRSRVWCVCLWGPPFGPQPPWPGLMFLPGYLKMPSSGKAAAQQFKNHKSNTTVHFTDGEMEAQRREINSSQGENLIIALTAIASMHGRTHTQTVL